MKKTRTRFLSILLAVCMVLPLMPTVAFATGSSIVEVGPFTLSTEASGLVESTDYSYADGLLILTTNKEVTVANTNPSVSTTDGIVVQPSSGDSNITLNGVNIENSSTEAMTIHGGGTVTLAESSVNTLIGNAGLRTFGSVTITGTGSLTAGSNGELGGITSSLGGTHLTITGGTIIANGNANTSGPGDVGSAGIHGETIVISGSAHIAATGTGISAGIGSNGSMGGFTFTTDITISDNTTVTAVGGNYAAGIGGGCNSGNTTVNISGGSISAVGGESATGIGGGYGEKTVIITITGGKFTQGSTAAQTVCDAAVATGYYVSDNSGDNTYPYIVQQAGGLTVAPQAIEVQKGRTQQFSALGTSETVTWSVTGGISGTTINNNGLLTVAADETASTLTVTATAGSSPANATVTVIEPYHTVSFASGEGSGTAASVVVTKTGGAFTYILPNVGSGSGEIDFTPPSGKSFAGWLVGNTPTATAAGDTISLTEDVTLTAHWAREPVLYLGGTAIIADSTSEVTGTNYSYIYDTATATGTLILNGYSNTGNYLIGDSYCTLYANFNLILELNGHNTLEGPDDAGNNQIDSCGIYIDGGSLTIEGSGSLVASGGEAFDSYGIVADNISITGGTVVATATNGTLVNNYYCEPLLTEKGNLSITGGNLTLQNHTPNESGLMNLYSNLTVGDGYVTKVDYRSDGSDAYEIKSTDLYTYEHLFSYVEIMPGISMISPGTTFYPLWVSGVQVTSANANAIQSGVSYSHANKTLTLNDANITAVNAQEGVTLPSDVCSAGVYFEGDLTLSLAGDSSITGGTGMQHSWGICSNLSLGDNDNDLTIKGVSDATLEVTAGDAEESCGIGGDHTNLILQSGKVTASGGTAINTKGGQAKSCGVDISFDKTFTYSGGMLTAIAGEATSSDEHAAIFSIGLSNAPTDGSVLVSGTAPTGDLKQVEGGKEISDYPYAIVYQPYQITGIIKGSDTGENGLEGAQVQLKNTRGNVGTIATTGQTGDYAISFVPEGTYNIEVSKNGYITDVIENVTVTNSNLFGKDITLTKGTSGVSITVHPQNVTVQKGGTATFTVEATNATGYQWYCSATENDIPQGGNGIITDSSGVVSGATTKSLTIHTVTDKMSGETIWCAVKGSDPSDNVGSNSATLTVIPIPPTITSVEVTPATANVQKGTTQQFNAQVSGTGDYDDTVNWSIVEAVATGTTISDTGILSVAADETATTLTVKVTSVGDNTKHNTATVIVTDTPVTTYTLTVANGTGSGDYETGTVINITAKAPTAGKQFKDWTTSNGGSFTSVSSATTTFTMPANAVTITANYEDIPVVTYPVVVEGSYATTTGAGSYAKDATVNIYAGSRNNYSFNGWTVVSGGVSITNSGGKNASFTMPDNAITVKANWSYNGGSGGSSSGGGSSSSSGSGSTNTTTITEKKPNQPVTVSAPITATAGTNGGASASIPERSVTDAIAKAQADAKAQGKTANGTTVALNVTMPKGVTSLTTNLTRNSLNSLVSAGVTSLELNGSPVTVSFDKKVLAEIQKQSSGNISITIVPNTSLSASAKTMIGTRPVYDLTVSYTKNGKNATVSGFGGGTATVSVPYTPAKGEAVGGLYAVYVDEAGNTTRIAGSAYDANSGCVMFTTTHFSLYGIGYTAPSAKFMDITNHWAKETIDYVVGRGLLCGTTETTFAPNTAMTRGMLVTVLGRLTNVDTKVYTTGSFTDVTFGSAFQPYIEWAYKKGIVHGTGGGKFEPDRAITREEIAVIFSNYAKATGYTLPVTRTATTYADDSSIGSAYKTAVTAMQQAGIMTGGTGNKFNPKSSATRAEVSSMLNRYIKLTIDPVTAQGWALNDAGQYLYYKDSKVLTGTQTIDGVKYFFGTDGTLKTGWVKKTDGWRFYSGNKMITSWWNIGSDADKKTYYFTRHGLMISDKWLEIDGKWYYFYTDGSLARDTKVDGYEVGSDGERKTK